MNLTLCNARNANESKQKGPTTKQIKLEKTECQKSINSKIVNSEKDTGSTLKKQKDSSEAKMASNDQKPEDYPDQGSITQSLEAKIDFD